MVFEYRSKYIAHVHLWDIMEWLLVSEYRWQVSGAVPEKNIMGSYFVGVVAKAPPMWLVVQLCEVEGGPAIGFWICMTFAKGFTH